MQSAQLNLGMLGPAVLRYIMQPEERYSQESKIHLETQLAVLELPVLALLMESIRDETRVPVEDQLPSCLSTPLLFRLMGSFVPAAEG